MKALAEIFIAFLELLEAEGAALRAGIIRLGVGLAVLAVAGALLLVGLGFMIWSLYLYLGTVLDPPATALASGLIILAVAGSLVWSGRRYGR